MVISLGGYTGNSQEKCHILEWGNPRAHCPHSSNVKQGQMLKANTEPRLNSRGWDCGQNFDLIHLVAKP